MLTAPSENTTREIDNIEKMRLQHIVIAIVSGAIEASLSDVRPGSDSGQKIDFEGFGSTGRRPPFIPFENSRRHELSSWRR